MFDNEFEKTEPSVEPEEKINTEPRLYVEPAEENAPIPEAEQEVTFTEDVYSSSAPVEAEEKADEDVFTEPESEPTVVEEPTRVYGYEAPSGAEGQSANPYSYGQPGYQGQYYYQHYQQPIEPDKSETIDDTQKKGKKIFFAAIALILVFALGVGTATIFQKGNKNSGITSGDAESISDGEKTTGDNAKLELNTSPTDKKSNGEVLTPAEIYEKVRQSNVGIVVYSNATNASAGEGSGIVMGLDSTGKNTYIITCAHVISDAGISVKVQTEDGTNYEGTIVGFDQRTDIGVIKVASTKFVTAEFGDSSALKIGDPVYAVGNPGGVEFFGSFTTGHVSAINRPVNSEIGYTMKCIQHNAAINPGNSGGMLVNQYGQVIGINSQKIASSSYEGMGFAIPISSAKEIIDSLIQYGYVPNRPKLGITYIPVSASRQYYMIAQVKGLPAGTLIINEISSDSSLAGTQARKYDMIIAVNGKPLDTAETLLGLIDGGKVGDKLTLTLCRVNSNYSVDEFDVTITLVEDKGGTTQETTTQAPINPFDYYFGYGN